MSGKAVVFRILDWVIGGGFILFALACLLLSFGVLVMLPPREYWDLSLAALAFSAFWLYMAYVWFFGKPKPPRPEWNLFRLRRLVEFAAWASAVIFAGYAMQWFFLRGPSSNVPLAVWWLPLGIQLFSQRLWKRGAFPDWLRGCWQAGLALRLIGILGNAAAIALWQGSPSWPRELRVAAALLIALLSIQEALLLHLISPSAAEPEEVPESQTSC